MRRYARLGKPAFESQELIQVSVLHHLGIIGEAVNALPPELLERSPETPWKKIIGLRNRSRNPVFPKNRVSGYNAQCPMPNAQCPMP